MAWAAARAQAQGGGLRRGAPLAPAARRTSRRARAPATARRGACALEAGLTPVEVARLAQEGEATMRACCRLVRRVRERMLAPGELELEKADRTPVTVADFAVQAVVGSALTIPGVLPLVAEEGADELRRNAALAHEVASEASVALRELGLPELDVEGVLEAIDLGMADGGGAGGRMGLRWVLDPIDGTAGFLRGCGAQYVIGLALLDGTGEPVLGWMGMPDADIEPSATWAPLDNAAAARSSAAQVATDGGPVTASLGKGVLLSARADFGCIAYALDELEGAWTVRVAETAYLSDGIVAISDHETPRWALPGDVQPKLRRQCCGSLCKYALVATGHAAAFFQHPVGWAEKLKTWDHAAGVACVEAAGGLVTGFSGDRLAPQMVYAPPDLVAGRELYPARGGVVVTNALCHEEAMKAVNEALDNAQQTQASDGARETREVLPPPSLLLMVDRDGTINRDVGSPGVTRREDFALLPGVAEAIKQANNAGWAVCVVTNQSAVSKGLLSEQGLGEIHEEMRVQLAEHAASVDEIIYATDLTSNASVPNALCSVPGARRKPSPQMLEEGMAQFAVPAASSVYIGDTASDMLAAKRAGIARSILVGTGYGQQQMLAAQELGLSLPCVADSAQPLGLPEEVLPIELHADLASAICCLIAEMSE